MSVIPSISCSILKQMVDNLIYFFDGEEKEEVRRGKKKKNNNNKFLSPDHLSLPPPAPTPPKPLPPLPTLPPPTPPPTSLPLSSLYKHYMGMMNLLERGNRGRDGQKEGERDMSGEFGEGLWGWRGFVRVG